MHAPCAEDVDPVAVACGHIEVVQDDDDGAAKIAQQFENLVLVADVEVVRGLVEEDAATSLRERPGDDDALAFTAG